MSYSDMLEDMEFSAFPERREVRPALEGLQVDPETDVITLIDGDKKEEYCKFNKGNLRDALAHLSTNGTTVTVQRNGTEIFRLENICDLFGSVYF